MWWSPWHRHHLRELSQRFMVWTFFARTSNEDVCYGKTPCNEHNNQYFERWEVGRNSSNQKFCLDDLDPRCFQFSSVSLVHILANRWGLLIQPPCKVSSFEGTPRSCDGGWVVRSLKPATNLGDSSRILSQQGCLGSLVLESSPKMTLFFRSVRHFCPKF